MKKLKTFLLIVAACLLLAGSGCDADGSSSPRRRIANFGDFWQAAEQHCESHPESRLAICRNDTTQESEK